MGRTDPDRWREVVVLLGGIKALEEPEPVWELLDALTPGDENETQLADAWGLRLAVEILAESMLKILQRDKLTRPQRRILQAIQQSMPDVLESGLPVMERVAVGRYLARIDDPRPEVNEVDAMRFCYVPAGSFYMGKGQFDEESEAWRPETPAMAYQLEYGYWIAQYPVTVAQFRSFVDDSGFDVGDSDALKANGNTPVVWVSQQEAMAFCGWLTRCWREKGWLTGDWQVTLPNEPEWEKAARGGQEIPVAPAITDIKSLSIQKFSSQDAMRENPEPQRRYPWGNAIDQQKANYAMNVGGVSTPGIYCQGISPYGCHDLSGNVWEWTRSEYKDYPYPAIDTVEWKQRERQGASVCVLRGGAFSHGHDHVRCAVRDGYEPDGRYDDIGFRVVLSPLR